MWNTANVVWIEIDLFAVKLISVTKTCCVVGRYVKRKTLDYR